VATIQKDRILDFRGQNLTDSAGDKIGKIEEIYLDTDTNEPEWALVTTGLFGSKQTFVPIRDASEADGSLRVPFAKDDVKDAPKVDPDGQLSQTEEAELYRHYGMSYSESDSDTGLGEGGAGISSSSGTSASGLSSTSGDTDYDRSSTTSGDVDYDRSSTTSGDVDYDRSRTTTGDVDYDRSRTTTGDVDYDRDASARGTVGEDVSGPETDDAMTRSEEELAVGTRQREAGRARLRKYVVTDEVQETVPVRREELRVEREPITDANVGSATDGPELSEEEHEVVLREEEAVVEKRVVPKERVRLDKDVEVEEKTVSESVAREEIEVDGDARDRDR
jgi:uncharacterized protein (TIGR02271 family)